MCLDGACLEDSKVIFRGTFSHSIDEKGRVSVPAQFRLILEEMGENTLIVTNYITEGSRCLEAYTTAEWQKFEQKLRKRSRFDHKVRALEHYYFSRAATCQLDSSGRVNIPQNLRNYAGIEKEVVFTGSFQGFRIWDKRVAELVFQEAETQLLENPDLFRDIDV